MRSAAASGASVDDVFQREASVIASQMAIDSPNTAYLGLWGTAIDYQQATATTYGTDPVVDYAIVDELNSVMGVAPRQDKVTHAGVQHTYSYLFSLLQTPYGYKRARWVEPDVTSGFGLPAGTLGPTPPDGTLFENATYLAGEIAFDGKPEGDVVKQNADGVAAAIVALDITTLSDTRLVENATLAAGRTIVLQTDFVQFPAAASTAANTYWLVYSVNDSGDGHNRLVTAFPISTSSFTQYTAASGLGTSVPISTAYNAWVDGLSGTTVMGSRTLSQIQLVQ
jgi:hypothetical protein